MIEEIGPSSAAETFTGPVESIASQRGTAGVAFVLGLAVAIWSASGYVGAFGRASHLIYERTDERPIWKQRPLQLVVTLAMVVLAALLTLGLVLSGPVVSAIADTAGIGSTAVTLWDLLKLPVMAAIFIAHGRPALLDLARADLPRLPLVLGGKPAWPSSSGPLASAAFAFYLANFGSYDATYGTLAGLVALLVWLWITNLAILFGHVLNAQLAALVAATVRMNDSRDGDAAGPSASPLPDKERLVACPSGNRKGPVKAAGPRAGDRLDGARPPDRLWPALPVPVVERVETTENRAFGHFVLFFQSAPPGTRCACPSCTPGCPASTSSG